MTKDEVGPVSPDRSMKHGNETNQLFKVSVTGKFEDLVRKALEIIDQDDPDGATVRNGIGFMKDDGEPARMLLEKDEWNAKDLNKAYNIAKHYKNTQDIITFGCKTKLTSLALSTTLSLCGFPSYHPA